MINGMNIFYSSKTGSRLKIVSTNKGKGNCIKKCNKIQLRGNGLKMLQ